MDQRAIMALLIEATTANDRRINEIQGLFVKAAHGGDKEILSTKDRAAGIRIVLEKLYVDTYTENPALLPTLFPVFAIICGDKDRTVVADVDWYVYYKYLAFED